MALPSGDRNGGESTVVDAPRLTPTPFLSKTYQLVDDRDIDDVISWNADGSAFVVWNTAVFAGDLLPKYFKHNNFSSFIRQLNTYGFRKVVPDRWEFSNDCFRRGDKKLLCDIQRRKIALPPPATPSPPPQTVSPSESGEYQVTSSSISPSSIFSFGDGTAELIGENKRLKKENVQLNKELSQMKSLCDNIYVLMSSFNGCRSNGDGEQSSAAMKPLDLLPMTRFQDENAAADGGDRTGDDSPGGPMCGKRGRESEGTPAEYGMDLQLQLPVGEIKFEPLDQEERLNRES